MSGMINGIDNNIKDDISLYLSVRLQANNAQ